MKARVRDPEGVRAQLHQRAAEQVETYQDTYFDQSGRALDSTGQELRVRVIETETGPRALLTHKDAAVDQASGSKPEDETEVAAAETVRIILGRLGYVEAISFTKRCRNYRFDASGWEMLATFVTVPGIDGTFLELETAAEESSLRAALNAVRAVLAKVCVEDGDLTTEVYTDAVRSSRSIGQ